MAFWKGLFGPKRSPSSPTHAPDTVLVGTGVILMGTNSSDNDARPVHQVTITRQFRMGKCPVTVGEFRRFVEGTRYRTTAELEGGSHIWDGVQWLKKPGACWHSPFYTQTENHPVTCVTWYDAAAFCNWLSEQAGLIPCYTIDTARQDPNNLLAEDGVKWTVACDFSASGFRLPTEAEWEYAARGGNLSRNYRYAGSNNPTEVAWFIDYGAASARPVLTREFAQRFNTGSPREVGQKRPNELGLYDMSGNVREWCWDWYAEGYYAVSPRNDPRGPASGAFRVNRGGSWQSNIIKSLESTERNYGGPAHCFTNFGFRVVASG